MLAISALVSAPKRVMAPAINHTASNNPGEPNCPAMTPGFRKMPEPMTPPTTIIMVVNKPSAGRRPALARWTSDCLEDLVLDGGSAFNAGRIAGGRIRLQGVMANGWTRLCGHAA